MKPNSALKEKEIDTSSITQKKKKNQTNLETIRPNNY